LSEDPEIRKTQIQELIVKGVLNEKGNAIARPAINPMGPSLGSSGPALGSTKRNRRNRGGKRKTHKKAHRKSHKKAHKKTYKKSRRN
jgi:hypothetical protein